MAKKKPNFSNDPVLLAFDKLIHETRAFTTKMREQMGKKPRTLATLAAKKGQKRASNRQLTEAQQAAFTSAPGDGGTESRAVERTFWQPEF